jgi:hypothetical protein
MIQSRTGRIRLHIPCIRAPSSDPWKRARWSSHQSTSRRRRRHPIITHHQHLPVTAAKTHPPPGGKTYNSEVLERPGGLDVLEGGGEVLELEVDGLLGGLGVLDGLDLEGVDGLELAAHVVGGRLELAEALLDLVDDGLVLERGAVGGEVDGGGLLREQLDLAAGILVALLEGLEGGDGLAAEAQRAGDLGPVELESSASLFGRE